MRWRNGETVGVEMSMVLLLSMNEADCLDQQHRRSSATTNRHLTGRSAYRASGLVQRPVPVLRRAEPSGSNAAVSGLAVAPFFKVAAADCPVIFRQKTSHSQALILGSGHLSVIEIFLGLAVIANSSTVIVLLVLSN
jgi:hypothetical protein